jgi:hypothetical protein
MDLRKYENLRNKINAKDFEGQYSAIDKWLYRTSFIGNAGSIFFAYFLIHPALYKAISIHMIDGLIGNAFAVIITIGLLTIFEFIKRYLIRNFSTDYVASDKKIKISNIGWLIITLLLVSLSFFFSMSGSKNFASTSVVKNEIIETNVSKDIGNLKKEYENKKNINYDRIVTLEAQNKNLENERSLVPVNYFSRKGEIQNSIADNNTKIETNLAQINIIDNNLKIEIEKIEKKGNEQRNQNSAEDDYNVVIFVIIVAFIESLIIGGVYFREKFEFDLYRLNKQKFENVYQKKSRYKILLTFIYGNGKANVGDKVISGLDLKELVSDKINSNKLVNDFLKEMDNLGVFKIEGKRRFIVMTYSDAMNLIDNYDDNLRILDNLK